MSLPCLKCIKYAICKQKKKIDCDALYYYIRDRNSWPIEMPNVTRLGHENPYAYHDLLKSTTQWWPDT